MNAPNKNDIASTREAMGKRLRTIIPKVIGYSRVRELIEAVGKNPYEYEDQSIGNIALKLNIINPATRIGLLIGQSAERTARLAEDVLSGDFKMPHVQYDHPMFDNVGMPQDPESLRIAQATWMSAQMFNNEARDHYTPYEMLEYAKGFKSAASHLYKKAAKIVEKEGHAVAAIKLRNVSQSLVTDSKPERTPSGAMRHLELSLWIRERSRSNGSCGDYGGSTPYSDAISRLEQLTLSKKEPIFHGKLPKNSHTPKG